MPGAAFDQDRPLFRLLNGFSPGIFKNTGPLANRQAGQPMDHPVRVDLRGGVFRIHPRAHRKRKLLARGIGVEQLHIHAVVQTEGIFTAKDGGTLGFRRVPQTVHTAEPAAVLERAAQVFHIIQSLGKQMRRRHRAFGADFLRQTGEGFLTRECHDTGGHGRAAVTEGRITEQDGIDARLGETHGDHGGCDAAANHGHLTRGILVEPAVLGGSRGQRGPRGCMDGIFYHGCFFLSAFFLVCDIGSKIMYPVQRPGWEKS